ncbi:PAS domain S-box protein [Acetobacter fabarum]|uniref:PAS domain S-box protein n=1 Tax=Acetobacter fabarum TaxID=483199 RepID=UPI0039ECDEB4
MPELANPLTLSGYTNTFYAAILEQATDGVIIIDDQNRIVFFNAAAEHLWGCSASAVLGNNVDLLIPLGHRQHHNDYIEHHRKTGIHRLVNTSREVTFVRSNGDYVAAELSLSTALIGKDNKRYYMAFIKGVTEEVHRRKLLELQSEVFAALADYTTIHDVADMLCSKVEELVPNSIATLLHITPQGGALHSFGEKPAQQQGQQAGQSGFKCFGYPDPTHKPTPCLRPDLDPKTGSKPAQRSA